ncbi:uncharacterized protein LOC131954875 isoform X2 [Physella acuta]|nr:uncharacterized protein LOC131954875 isoform X2 [Physella acuta]
MSSEGLEKLLVEGGCEESSNSQKDLCDFPPPAHFIRKMSGSGDAYSKSDVSGIYPGEASNMKMDMAGTDSPCDTLKRRRMFLDTSSNTSNISSRSESPTSFNSSRSETPTSTLTRAERQNELWKAIGSIDTFLMDKDIIEACQSTASDLICDDEDFVGAPNVSFTEFLQQYRELTEWLNQVHKVTQREVTSLSEKYLNQSYHEEMLERSPRREFLNNYSRQLLVRYPNMADEISARMARLNTQWTAVEQAIAPKYGKQDADTMFQDLECDLNTLRRWLNAIEAKLLPLTLKADWSDTEVEEKLLQHQALQREIESHNKIVNAVLKLSERLELDSKACGTRGHDSLQTVALNLERRWHGIWLQSLEWQCRLEGAITKRKEPLHCGFDFSNFPLSEIDESLFSHSGHSFSEHLIQLDDDSLLFIGHRDDFAENTSNSGDCYRSLDLHGSRSSLAYSDQDESLEDVFPQVVIQDSLVHCGSGAHTPTAPNSPSRPAAFFKPDSPLGKRPFPGPGSGEASPAKRGSQSPSSSSGGLSPVSQESPLDSFIISRGLHISSRDGLLINSMHHGDTYAHLKQRKAGFGCSSGDSANISETESKMGDSPPSNNLLRANGHYAVTSSDGEGDPPAVRRFNSTDVKDIGYSSESQSNDEVEVMGHQIDLEYRYQGKCEVASDGPLGEKISLPSTAVKPIYYMMTHVDADSTDRTDTGDTTDSGAEKIKKGQLVKKLSDKVLHNDSFHSDKSTKELEQGSLNDSYNSGSDRFEASVKEVFSELDAHKESDSLDEAWDLSSLIPNGGYHQTSHAYGGECVTGDKDAHLLPMYTFVEFSESDSAPESREKKSIKYLIEHAEDLVKPSSPKHTIQPAASPKKQAPVQHSPSKQTQTDSCSTVESSCDASGEDNSDHEGALKCSSAVEDFSTATDDAEETLFNSTINLESADPAKNASADDISRPTPHGSPVFDSARLRKQTGGASRRRGKKDRPWSVVGLQEFNTNKRSDSLQQTIAASESAIDHLFSHTDMDTSTPTHIGFHSSTFPRDSHRDYFRKSFSSSEHSSSSKCARRKIKYSGGPSLDATTPTNSETTLTGVNCDESVTADGTCDKSAIPGARGSSQPSENSSGAERSPAKNHKPRRLRRRSSLEKKDTYAATLTRSSTTDSYDSAEAESESETTDEYLTAPMEAATSDGDDVHNVSGSFSENCMWDNFQVLYPTASEDPGEELLEWDPQDELEFDDDFQLNKKHRKSLVSAVMGNGLKRSKLKFTKQGMPGDDSDSDLDDFHHILDQSELQLKLADQSLRKKRKDPMGTGLHPDPAKYEEIIVTYETNINCLKTICQHLKSDDITPEDIKRVNDIMYQWEKLYALASERHTQATALGKIRDHLVNMETCIKQAEECLPFDRFSSSEELKKTISLLKEKKEALQIQGQQLEEIHIKMTEFSALHPTINVARYLQEMSDLQKSTNFMYNKVTEHLGILENNWSVWLEYLDSQQELDSLLSADRERLHALLCQREYGIKVTRTDVVRELEKLQSNLCVYESKLSLLQAMRNKLTKTSDENAQRILLAAFADLRNQLFVVSERCQQMYQQVEEDEDVALEQQSDLGKLAVSAASLHEALKTRQSMRTPEVHLEASSADAQTKSSLNRSCAAWLRSLPVQVVALMLVAGLVCALDPDILDRLTNFKLTITPELHYVNGPPSI